MVTVVCSSCSVREIPNVIDHLPMGIVELLWYASVICVMRERLCVAMDAVSVAPWTASCSQSIGCMYTHVWSR